MNSPRLEMAKQVPTDYFTLPLEIRQQILAYTFPDLLQKDLALNRHLLRINYLFVFGSPLPTSAPHIHNWATVLVQAHESIALDLPFLLKPLLKEIGRNR